MVTVALAVGGKAWGQAPGAGPSLVFSGQGVQVTGMTPGGTVAWFTIGRTVVENAEILSERAEQTMADGQGRATLAVTGAVPRPSIWVAVDLKTGAYALDGPPGFPARRFELGAGALRLGGGAGADRLRERADPISVLLVRPGLGAWSKRVGRGGVDDESSPDDRELQFALDKLLPLGKGGGSAPGRVSGGDLLFVVHPRTMEIAALALGARP